MTHHYESRPFESTHSASRIRSASIDRATSHDDDDDDDAMLAGATTMTTTTRTTTLRASVKARGVRVTTAQRGVKGVVRARATDRPAIDAVVSDVGRAVCGAALAVSLAFGGVVEDAVAGEIEILGTPAPTEGYIVDDAGLMSRSTATAVNKTLKELEDATGFHMNVITVRKLVFETDPFAFGDKVLETWYPTVEEGNDKGNLLLVKSTKDGALVGGPKFLKSVGDDLIDSVLTSNYGVNLEQEKYNEALLSSVKRVTAVLEGKEDPGPPEKYEAAKGSNFKTRKETNEKRDVFANVVIGLLVISFVVPMLQYAGYVVGDPDFDE